MAGSRHVRFERGAFRFSGDCAACRPACRAVCCRGMRAPLADEEIASGRYDAETVDGRVVLRPEAISSSASGARMLRQHTARHDGRQAAQSPEKRNAPRSKRT